MHDAALSLLITGALVILSIAPSAPAEVNVALGKPVTVVSGFSQGVDVSTLTDGIFLADDTFWQDGTVWWTGFDTVYEINLLGTYELHSGIVQADDNDAYTLQYHDPNLDQWLTLWDIPNYDKFGSGMQTRPNPDDVTEAHFFGFEPLADRLRIFAASGDALNSLSEVQVYGVPGPGALTLAAIATLFTPRRRR